MEIDYSLFGIDGAVAAWCGEIAASLRPRFAEVDAVAEQNQLKVLRAMQSCRVDAECFAGTTGYGYDDVGRDTLERVYAAAFHTESALVRPQLVCGTHALAVALSANLLPGDELLSPVGKPYDTLEEVIGIRPSPCSLAEYGVTYAQVELLPDGGFDYDGIRAAINEKTKVITVQRSKGYAMRPTLSVARIGELIAFCKQCKPDVLVMVDNWYGEFTETLEPSDVGADMIVGSLIKNPGGGLAPIGGYICGTKQCVDRCAYRLSAPGLGQEVGASLDVKTALYQGFFLAPTVAASALKGAIFAARLYETLGFRVLPDGTESRHDVIQAIELGSAERLIAFCEGIQAAAPVDSYVKPVPAPMPGYDSDVIMAAGAFVQGSSIELSADGPLRPPYAVYFQGGLTWPHAKLGVMMSLQKLFEKGLVNLPAAGADPGNPVGNLGKAMLRRMNGSHRPLRDWAFAQMEWKPDMRILDVGCGGGAAIADMLERAPGSVIYGADPSPDALILAGETNAAHLGSRVFLEEAGVSALPFPEESFDLVTAVETVYFWPSPAADFREIRRVLKPGGRVAVLCEADDPAQVDMEKLNFALTVYRPEELGALLRGAPFRNVLARRRGDGYLLVTGEK